MKQLILILFLFPSLLFAQESASESDFVTVTIKIVDMLDECTYVDVPFHVTDSSGKKYNYEDIIVKKIRTGKHLIALKKGQKYILETSDFHIDEETSYYSEKEEIDLTIPVCIVRVSEGGYFIFDNINFHKNEPKSGRKEDLQEAILCIKKSVETCNSLVAFLNDYRVFRLKPYGHATPDEESPEQLSEWRALAVRNYLIEHGIESKRVDFGFFGTTKEMMPNDSEPNRSLNRRVQVSIIHHQYPCEEEE